jgi:hypothetical protein
MTKVLRFVPSCLNFIRVTTNDMSSNTRRIRARSTNVVKYFFIVKTLIYLQVSRFSSLLRVFYSPSEWTPDEHCMSSFGGQQLWNVQVNQFCQCPCYEWNASSVEHVEIAQGTILWIQVCDWTVQRSEAEVQACRKAGVNNTPWL